MEVKFFHVHEDELIIESCIFSPRQITFVFKKPGFQRFVVSSFKTKSLGLGKKSSTILISPMGSSVYLTLSFFINFPSFSPISCAKNTNYLIFINKTDSYNCFINLAKTIITFLFIWKHIMAPWDCAAAAA